MHRLVHKRLDQRGVQQAAEPLTEGFLVQRDAELDRFTKGGVVTVRTAGCGSQHLPVTPGKQTNGTAPLRKTWQTTVAAPRWSSASYRTSSSMSPRSD